MLQVGIVGAGIAGLSAAIALSKAGHDVEIFEKSQFKHETGAAVTIGPNGTRILSRWGFDFEKAGAVDCTRMTRVRADTLELEEETSFMHVGAAYGNRWCLFHRADLHARLRALTDDLSPRVKINLGQAIADLDVDAGIIRLSNDTEVEKDLVIVADGAHSSFISKFIGRPYPVHKSPLSLYRFLLPFEQMLGYPETEKFFNQKGHGFTAFYKAEIGRPGRMMTTYACRSGTLIYCAVMHVSKPKEKGLEGWTSPASAEDVMSVVEDFHPAVQAICQDAKDVKVYTSMWRDPVETFTKGKSILIGDACHLMLPTHGQGACMALEDAMALGVIFEKVSKPDEVSRSIQTYNKLRMPRVAAIQTMSNKMRPGMEEAMLAEVKLYFDGPLPSPQARTFSTEYNNFFFAYDVAEEAKQLQE